MSKDVFIPHELLDLLGDIKGCYSLLHCWIDLCQLADAEGVAHISIGELKLRWKMARNSAKSRLESFKALGLIEISGRADAQTIVISSNRDACCDSSCVSTCDSHCDICCDALYDTLYDSYGNPISTVYERHKREGTRFTETGRETAPASVDETDSETEDATEGDTEGRSVWDDIYPRVAPSFDEQCEPTWTIESLPQFRLA